MCRLFGLTAYPQSAHASFWLLDAPDSLSVQSHRDPDGAGLGCFTAQGIPVVDKQPIAAFADRQFAAGARLFESTTFVAHVRFASTGAHTIENTHPFEQAGRLFAHNGVIEEVDKLDAVLGPARALLHGDTDSERYFALITRRIREHGGDVTRGITDAVRWIAAELPVFSINMVLTTPTDLWALRYPATHRLFVLERPAGAVTGRALLDHRSTLGSHIRSLTLADHPSVVVASERLDDDEWRLLEPGELLHASSATSCTSTVAVSGPPKRLLRLEDLQPVAASSQQSQTG